MIKVNNLSFSYAASTSPTLKEINFSVAEGEIFGFLGPSGAGKSTTQKILMGILKNYLGNIQVFGQELKDIKQDYYEQIGAAFEFPNFYPKFTALENLCYFKSLYKVETENPLDLLEMVGLTNDADLRVSSYSKGMKMRLNFCRALLNNPKIVFLDEPTSGLDPVNAKRVKDIILKKKAERKTIFLTTHNMQVAEDICDRVAFIIDGSIKLIDSPRNLKLQNGHKTIRIEYLNEGTLKSQEFPIQGLGQNKEFIKFIQDKELETVHTQEATLEDVFIAITGRSLT